MSQPNNQIANRAQIDLLAALKRMVRQRESSVLAVLMLLCIGMAFTGARDSFFSPRNAQNVMQQVALLSIFAIGETLVIITGGIDLSLGSLVAFSGMVVALFVTTLGVKLVAVPAIVLAILGMLLIAAAIGSIHATLIHKLRLPPFVVTLASLLVLRSQSLVIKGQLPISLAEYPALLWLANGMVPLSTPVRIGIDVLAVAWLVYCGAARRERLLGAAALAAVLVGLHLATWYVKLSIPIPVFILAAFAVVAHLLLTRARIGRYLYSIGSNEQATRLSGVNVFGVKLFAYCASAILGATAGILLAAYGGQGDPLAGNGYELDAVAAAVVGGANLMGGQGSVIGTILGALLLHTILSAINLTLSSPDIWRGTVVGGVLLFAVFVTALQQGRKD